MGLLDKSGIKDGERIDGVHVSNIYDTFNESGSFSIQATGSFSGSFSGALIGTSSYATFAVSASHEITFEQSSSHADFANSASLVMGASQPNITTFTSPITASIVSASNTVFGVTGSFSHLQGNSAFTVGDQVTFQQPVTASGNISASGNIIGELTGKSGAVTGLNSILNPDLILGVDGENKIDFGDATKINFHANGAKEVELTENSLSPGTSDGTALGTTSLQWSDLFLAEGAVINFDNGDVTITQTGDNLAIAGTGTSSFDGRLDVVAGISSSGTIVASNLSGTNTGDQNITNLAVTGSSVIFNQITASSNISLPTNNASINMINGSILSRTGGSYPGIQLNTGATDNTIWFLSGNNNSIGNQITASFVDSGFLNHVGIVRAKSNSSLLLQGGSTPNDVNDGVKIETADNSNIYQPRFAIESDAGTVDAYFTNINGLGINDDTPNAMLDVNGNINTTSHITSSGNISASGNFIGEVTGIGGAVTGITSLLATDIKIGEDDETKIDFEDANKINFYANNAKEVELAENSLSPGTSDGTSLGTTSLQWSDLFLAEGAVINFDNGDVTITQTGDELAIAGTTATSFVGDVTSSGKFKGDGSTLSNLQRPITSSAIHFTASVDNAGFYFRTGGNVTCSIQLNTTQSISIGTEYEFMQTASAGYLCFTTQSGVTLNSKDSKKKLAGQFSGATLKKVGTNEFDLIGDLG